MFIKGIKARQILDSKGQPTVEAILQTNQGNFTASVPSGISTGKYEARELRDKDGGVKKACQNIEKIIAPALKNEDPCQQDEIDSILIELDKTKNKSRLGANAILAVSLAVCRAGAKAKKMFLWQHLADLAGNTKLKMPIPCFLLFEGGKHGQGAVSTQEFMLVTKLGTLAGRMALMKKVYALAKTILDNRIKIGKEGGFISSLASTASVLETISRVIEKFPKAGFKIVLDMAASHFIHLNKPIMSVNSERNFHFFKRGKGYLFEGVDYSSAELLRFYRAITAKYPVFGIEDPFAEDDWQGFKKITQELGKKILIIGDDLLATNFELAKKAAKEKACHAMTIKPNQVGTVTETIGVANFAKQQGLKLFAKHRGGETKDSFLADLAVGLGTDYIAAGGFFQKERLVKYERLLAIEKELRVKHN